jgi:Tfp pilus assembly protein PilF
MTSRAQLFVRFASLTLLLSLPLASGCATSSARRAEQELDARKAVSHLDIGSDHLSQGRQALALREFMAAEKLDPKNPQVQNALGEAYLAQGKRVESEAHYRRAIELFPDYHDARLSLAVLLILEERYPEAALLCSALIEDPTFPAPWRALANLGFAELQQGELHAARQHLELAREYQKDYWPATLSLAQIELKEGHRREAIALLREVLELDPGAAVAAQANYQIAEIYISLGQRDQAVAHLSTAVTQTPDGLWGRRSEEYLKLLR